MLKRGKEFLSNYEQDIEKVIQDFGCCSARELELRATIYYCYRFAPDHGRLLSRKSGVKQVRGLKPRFPEQEIETAVDWLARENYLELND